jgi:hypothetical protein
LESSLILIDLRASSVESTGLFAVSAHAQRTGYDTVCVDPSRRSDQYGMVIAIASSPESSAEVTLSICTAA